MSAPGSFVGRTAELAVLAEELGSARAGRARVVWLTGIAGIGKSALLERFRHDAAGVTVLWADGDEAEVGLPYGILTQLLTEVADAHPPPADADPLRAGADLLGVLGELQSAGPVVLLVDDAQWADDLSTRALVFVARRLRHDQVLIVAGVRDDGVPLPQWDRLLAQDHLIRRLPLGGLDADDVAALSTAVDGPALTPSAARRLEAHTEGHPLHVRALLAELPAEGLADMSAVLPAPQSLTSLVLVRLSALSRPAQDLVLAASVLGHRCTLSDLVALAAVPDPLPALGEAVAAGLLRETPAASRPGVAFAHPLLRAAVYGDIAPQRRHALHHGAAGVTGGAAALDHRVAAAAGPDPGLAAELASLGDAEREARRWRDSAEHLLAAADLSPTYDARSARLVGAVDSMLAGGDVTGGLRAEPELRASAPSSGRSRVLGQLAGLSGRFALAREELTASVEEAVDGAGHDRAKAAASLALVSLIEGDPAAAVTSAERALGAGTRPDPGATARFVRVLGLAAAGRHSDAATALEPGDGRPGSGTSAETSGLRGLLALWTGDAGTALSALSEAVRDGSPGIPMQGRILILGSLAEAQYRLGDWDDATVNAELAISLARDAGVLLGAGITQAIAGYVAAGRGDWESARARVDAAEAAARFLPWWGSRAYAAVAAATLAHARGEPDAVLAALRPLDDPVVRRLVDAVGPLSWRVLRVEGLLGTDREDEADAALTDLETRVAARPASWSSLDAARLRARREELRHGHAEEAYRRAAVLAEHAPWVPARARLDAAHGAHLLAAGDRRTAVDLLRAARDSFRRLGAAPSVAECDELLRRAGLHPPAAGDPLGLTTQELAVARSVVHGRTNRETGAELFITGRTVAYHLSNIYAKLGISSRRELADRLPGATRPEGSSPASLEGPL